MRLQFTLFSLLIASGGANANSSFNLTEGVIPLSHDIYVTVAKPAPAAEALALAMKPAVAAAATPAPAASAQISKADLMQKGQQVFESTCTVCHQSNGEGQPPTYPALKGSAIVTGPVDVLLNRVLNGKPGTAMQAFKDQLDDNDLAAVITYERNAWGNNASIVQPADVTAARNKPPTGN